MQLVFCLQLYLCLLSSRHGCDTVIASRNLDKLNEVLYYSFYNLNMIHYIITEHQY